MVAPHVIVFYSSTWKCVVKRKTLLEKDMTNFIKDLPVLRDYLSCAVCRKLLTGSPLFSVEMCDHFVCKDCKGAHRGEDQICENCTDWDNYSEDETLEALIAGHKRYCRNFLLSSISTSLLELIQQKDPSIDAFKILNILSEGAKAAINRLQVVPKKVNVSPVTLRSPERSSSKLATVGTSNSIKKKSVEMNCASGTSISKSSTSRINSNFVRDTSKNITKSFNKNQNVIKVTLDSDIEIDVKIEPAFQRLDNEEKDSDSRKKFSNTFDSFDDFKEEEKSCNTEDDKMDVDDSSENTTISHDDFTEEDTEEYSGNNIQPSTTNRKRATPTNIISTPQRATLIAPRPIVTPKIVAPRNHFPTPTLQMPPRQIHSYVLTRPVATVGSPLQNQPFSPNLRLPAGQTIRLARFAMPDGRPVTMVRQIYNNQGPSGIRHIAFPLNAADLMQKKIIVRPGTSTATTTQVSQIQPSTQMQRWPDSNAVLQYASGSIVAAGSQNTSKAMSIVSSAPSIRPTNTHTIPQQFTKVNLTNFNNTSPSSSNSTSTSSSSISSGSVLINHNHVGVSNVGISSTGTVILTDSSGKLIGNNVVKAEPGTSMKMIKPLIQPKPPHKAKISTKIRSGCRCGNAASQPSKLTCCGQRCICYVDGKSCVDCKCRGCNNPYIPGGKKVMQGINTVIDAKTNTPVLMSGANVTAIGGVNNVINIGGPIPSTSSAIVTNVSVASPVHSTMNLVSMIPSSNSGPQQQLFTRIHHPGTQPTTTTYVANFTNQFGQFTIPLPISLISPGNAGHTIQSHSDAIHLQNLQLNPNLQNH